MIAHAHHIRKHRTEWTDEERERLVEQAATLRQNDPTITLTQIANHIMQQWPEDRRRDIQSATNPSFNWLVEGVRQKLYQQRMKARENIEKAEPQIVHIERDPRDIIAEMPFETFMHEFTTRLITHVRQAEDTARENKEMLQRILSRLPANVNAQSVAVHANRVLRAVIVGLLPVQANAVEKHFSNRIQFIFVDSDTSKSKLPDADVYMIMTKFIRHKWQGGVDDRSKLIWCHGGVTDAIRQLERFVS